MASLQQTLDQERAKSAWEHVKAVKDNPFEEKYSSLVKKAPMYILTNGLGQTLAFILSKAAVKPNKPPTTAQLAHQRCYDHINEWIGQQMQADKSLLEWLLDQDSAAYRRATVETLAYLNWLKRFAEANLKSEEDDQKLEGGDDG